MASLSNIILRYSNKDYQFFIFSGHLWSIITNFTFYLPINHIYAKRESYMFKCNNLKSILSNGQNIH